MSVDTRKNKRGSPSPRDLPPPTSPLLRQGFGGQAYKGGEGQGFELTAAQKKAASTINKSIAILAGAGSGKTAVLIKRIINIVRQRNANLSEIVAITFTEKAAGELVYRLTAEIPPEFRPQIDLATITTIHGFCTKILREDASAIGINPEFSILEEHSSRILNHRITSKTIKELLKGGDNNAEIIVEELEYKYAISCLEDMVENRWHITNWINARSEKDVLTDATSKREEDVKSALIETFLLVNKALEEEKKRIGALDFLDLEIKTLNLFESNKEIGEKYQNRIKHLLIDEFQDTSDLQVALIGRIFNPKKNRLCIVGDPGQSIYRFRGANPSGIQEIRELIEEKDGFFIELTDNFRSTKPVIDFVNSLFNSEKSAPLTPVPLPKEDVSEAGNLVLDSALPCTVRYRALPRSNNTRVYSSSERSESRTKKNNCEKLSKERGGLDSNRFLPLVSKVKEIPGSGIAVLTTDGKDLLAEEIRKNEAENIAEYIKMLGKDYGYGEIAILFKGFTDIQIYEDALGRRNIPYYRSGGQAFLEQPEIADIILCLKALVEPDNNTLIYGLARSSLVGMTDEELYPLLGRYNGGSPSPPPTPSPFAKATEDKRLRRASLPSPQRGEGGRDLPPPVLPYKGCCQTDFGLCHPCEGRDPVQLNALDSRFRGNDMEVNELENTFHKEGELRSSVLRNDGRLKFFFELLEIKKSLGISELVKEIVDKSGLYHLCEMLRHSGQPTANIEKFIYLIESLTDRYNYSLEEFIDYIDDLKVRGIGISEPPVFSPRDNAVKLLTIHAAKGLEFSVVILADLTRGGRNYTLPYIIRKGEDIGLKIRKGENPIADREKTALFEEIYTEESEQDELEKERLLYVAATRAKEILTLCNVTNTKRRGEWLKTLSTAITNAKEITIEKKEATPINTDFRTEFGMYYDGVLTAPLKSFTVSQLDSFYRCPQEYYMKYVLNVPSEMISPYQGKMAANILGDMVHRIIEEMSKNPETNWKSLVGTFSNELGYTNPDEKDVRKVTDYVEKYLSSEYNDTKLVDPIHEIPFAYRIDNSLIKGTIDCIYRDGISSAIVDFKTGSATGNIEDKVKQYELQTATYALAAREALKRKVSKMTLFFIERGEASTIGLTDKDLQLWRKKIEKIIQSINNSEFDNLNDNRNCGACIYFRNRTCWKNNIEQIPDDQMQH